MPRLLIGLWGASSAYVLILWLLRRSPQTRTESAE
jgi:hypothetical protein